MADPFDTPGYRFALNRFPGDGVTTQWDLSFAGVSPGYISQDHVRAVIINDTTGVETPVMLGPGNFILPTRLQITPAVPVGSTLEVRRNSPKDEPLLDYTDGALMIEKNLDTSNQQTVYAVAEMVDRFADALDQTAEFSQAVLDRLADVEAVANEADDKADSAIVTAGQAVNIANSATALANQAIDTAEDAVEAVQGAEEAALLATQAANTATTAANNANTAATNATNTAAAAVNTAQAAVDTANDAVTTANNAEAVANGIDAKAQAALDASQDATDIANAATATANGIDAKATQALADSATALSTANGFSARIVTLEGRVIPTPLPSGAHTLDTYRTSGAFLQNANAGAIAGGASYPFPQAGTLVVYSGYGIANNLLFQEYTVFGPAPNGGRTFRRSAATADGAWQPWKELAYTAGVMTHTFLSTATNADTLITDNTFWSWGNTVVITGGSGWPAVPAASGTLHVDVHGTTNFTQTLVLHYGAAARPTVLRRSGTGGTPTWKAWQVVEPISRTNELPTADCGDVYIDARGWFRWNGTTYVADTRQQWLSRAVGEIIYLDDSIAGVAVPPTNDPGFRYVRLTAAHAYNSGVLSGETVSGSAPLVVATAVVNLAGSPINGRTIRLLNTEGRITRPSASAGALQDDALQQFAAVLDLRRLDAGGSLVTGWSGAASQNPGSGPAQSRIPSEGGAVLSSDRLTIDPSIGSARTSNETRMRNVGVTAFMRIL